MRTFAFLSLLAIVAAQENDESRMAQQGTCLVDSAEAVSDLMDASMFVWAAIARCGHGGEEVKCTISISSAIQSVNSMINVILRSLEKCGDIVNGDCGMAASVLTKSAAGLTAATGGIMQKCFPAPAHGNNWAHGEPAMCVVDVKNTAKSLFKTIKSFMGLNANCGTAPGSPCASNVLRIVSGFAGVGEYLAGAIGQCTESGSSHDELCVQESAKLVQQLTRVANAGVDMSTKCEATPAAVKIDARLFSFKKQKKQSALGGSSNLILAAFLPLTAIVSFVGGRFYANRRTGTEEAREFMSDNE